MTAEETQRIDWLVAESKRHDEDVRKLGVLYEDIDSKFRLLIEGFGALDKNFESFREDVGNGFEKIDYKFAYAFEKFEVLENKIDALDTRADSLEIKLDKKLDREEFMLYVKDTSRVR